MFRHAVAVVVLPFTMAVLVPVWIANANDVGWRAGASALEWVLQIGGIALLGAGLALFAASLRRFAADGDGTLAPWDPPKRLVVRGPYCYVRNPMISGVCLVLVGTAMALISWPHAAWAAAFAAVNVIFILVAEEPQLRRRFGEPYREYCRHVPRVIPRVTPWHGPSRPTA